MGSLCLDDNSKVGFKLHWTLLAFFEALHNVANPSTVWPKPGSQVHLHAKSNAIFLTRINYD